MPEFYQPFIWFYHAVEKSLSAVLSISIYYILYHLGLFVLMKTIEDAVPHPEILAPTTLEREEVLMYSEGRKDVRIWHYNLWDDPV